MKKLAQDFNTAAQDSNPDSRNRESEALPLSRCALDVEISGMNVPEISEYFAFILPDRKSKFYKKIVVFAVKRGPATQISSE